MIKHVEMLRNGYWHSQYHLPVRLGPLHDWIGSRQLRKPVRGIGIALQERGACLQEIIHSGGTTRAAGQRCLRWHHPGERVTVLAQALQEGSPAPSASAIHMALPLAELWQEQHALPWGITMRMAERYLRHRVDDMAEHLAVALAWDFSLFVPMQQPGAKAKHLQAELVMAHREGVNELICGLTQALEGLPRPVVESPCQALRRVAIRLDSPLLYARQGRCMALSGHAGQASFQVTDLDEMNRDGSALSTFIDTSLTVTEGQHASGLADPGRRSFFADSTTRQLLEKMNAVPPLDIKAMTATALGISPTTEDAPSAEPRARQDRQSSTLDTLAAGLAMGALTCPGKGAL